MKKICIKCKQKKDVSKFHKQACNKSGYRQPCKECVRGYPKPTIEERLAAKIKVDSNTGCWIWQGGIKRSSDPYGVIIIQNKRYLVHRLIYELINGEIPTELIVCHRCNNPPCCNPDHLYAGTRKDNMRDAIAIGTHVHGERTNSAKLTEEKVLEIRKDSRPNVTIANEYNVSETTIRYIKKRKTWKHI